MPIERAMNEAVAVIEEVARGKADMEDILHAIALGHGRGKDCTSICLCKAADQRCKCSARLNCLGCRYEIKSKAVLVQYIMHAVQLKNKLCTSLVEQQKRDWLLENTINPAIQEISYHIRQSADEDERSLYRQIIREVENNGITGKDQARGLLLLLQKRGIYKNLADFAQERGYDYAAYHFSRDPVICAYISSLTEAAEKALPLDILPVFVPLDLSLIIERSREEIVEMLRDRDKYYEKLYASANATLQPFQAKVRAYEEAQAELTVQLSKNGQLTEEKNALAEDLRHAREENAYLRSYIRTV